MNEKNRIVAALQKWIAQGPRLRFENYGSRKAYSAERRAVLRDRHDAERLLSAVQCIADITGEDLSRAFGAYSGRLTWDGERLEYTTGQYWPTEYRKAACAVLARALWNHFRQSQEFTTSGDVRRGVAQYMRNAGVVRRWFDGGAR